MAATSATCSSSDRGLSVVAAVTSAEPACMSGESGCVWKALSGAGGVEVVEVIGDVGGIEGLLEVPAPKLKGSVLAA
jgi:hypothetical protein